MPTLRPTVLCASAALLLAPFTFRESPLVAQEGGVWGAEEHDCADCHGAHVDGRGRSALVRSGMSEVAPQAPGINEHSVRCLQCHGTPGDRRLVTPERRAPLLEAIYLGGNLADDHALGTFSASDALARFDLFRDPANDIAILRPDIEPSGVIECASCHEVHASWLVTQQSQLQDDACLGCHDQGLDLGSHGIASCGSCHRMHGSPGARDLVRELRVDQLCGACHAGAPLPSNLGIESMAARPLHAEPGDTRCSGCHSIH